MASLSPRAPMRGAAIPILVAALGIAIFSCMDAVMKGLSIAIGAYNAMLWRSIVGTVLSAILMAATRVRWPSRSALLLHVQRSGSAGISVLLFFWGLVRVPMAEGVALTFLSPVIALILAAPMLGERIGRGAVIAAMLAVAGVVVIVLGKASQGAGPEALHGALAIVLASFFYAINIVLLRRSALVAGPIEIPFFMNLVFACLYLPAAPVAAIVPPLHEAPWLVMAAAFAIVSSLLLAWAYRRAEAQLLVSVEYTAFIWAAILGAIVFGETVSPVTLAGAVLIVAGCVIAARGKPAAGPSTEAAS